MDTNNDTASFSVVPSDDPGSDDTGHAAERSSAAPTRLGRYVILDELGRGGMGVVWTGYDPKLDRKVALKRLHGSVRMQVRQARFIREAQALARLNHPNIVTVHDVDTHDGQLYMAMEYVDGQTLEAWLTDKDHDWREIIEVFDQAGQGLAAAHAAGITHRDFKPSNMLITKDGRVKVFDFGLAKYMSRTGLADDSDEQPRSSEFLLTDRHHRSDREDPNLMAMIGSTNSLKLTKHGRFVGTPAYMAPEQYTVIDEHEIGAWTDQFSFGATLYEALFSELPFAGDQLEDIYANARDERIREPPMGHPIPGWVIRVIYRALRYEPSRRFPSMEALLSALRADPARRRRRLVAYAAGAGLVGLASFGAQQALNRDAGPTPCTGAAARLVGVWDDEARASVRRGLVETGLPFASDTAARVTAALDRYAETWTEQHTAVCEATRIHGQQSVSLLDVRMTCMERRRSELGALVRVLATPQDDTMSRAVTAVAGLRRVEPCATAQPSSETIIPEDPERRRIFLGIQGQLDDANAMLAAGHSADARDLAASAGREAAEAGLHRLVAQALVLEGRAHRARRESTTAEARLREGIILATEVHDARTELHGWIELLYTTGVLLDEPHEAQGLRFAAENALVRAGSPSDLVSAFAVTQVAVLLEHEELEDAALAGQRALDIVLESAGPGSLQYAQVLLNLGIMAGMREDWPLAERQLREGLALLRRITGPNHPEVASHGMNLANVLVQHARHNPEEEDFATAAYDEAEELFGQVLAFREASEGATGENVARTLANLGLLQSVRGKRVEARRNLQRAIEILRDIPGAEVVLAGALSNLGTVELKSEEHERAEHSYREALELQQRVLGHEHTTVGRTRLKLCRLLHSAGRHFEAIEECNHALLQFASGPAERTRSLRLTAHDYLSRANQALGRANRATIHRASYDALAASPEPTPAPER